MFTGGGTGGHVFPGIAVLDYVRQSGARVVWIGDTRGVERRYVRSSHVRYVGIPTGKLRRYLSLRNVSDLFRVAAGVLRAIGVVRRERPAVLFSKGGFVSVPVVIAAHLLRVPVVSHESDSDPGLATRVNARFSDEILVAYDATRLLFGARHRERVRVVGNPIRPEIVQGERARGIEFVGFVADDPRPVVLFLGGSSGAVQINELVSDLRPRIASGWRIVHQAGETLDADVTSRDYVARRFFGAEMPDVLAAADVVVSRAGASSLWECAANRKPMLLVPLGSGSRGDQARNAALFERAGAAISFAGQAACGRDALASAVAQALAVLEQDSRARATLGDHARDLVRTDAAEAIARRVLHIMRR